jgi:hypothetical protein
VRMIRITTCPASMFIGVAADKGHSYETIPIQDYGPNKSLIRTPGAGAVEGTGRLPRRRIAGQ